MDPIIPQQSEQPQYSVPEPKHFLNKKFIVTLVVLLLFGTGAYAGIWYWQNQQYSFEEMNPVFTFTPRPSVAADSTADWKTYTNTQYGFEVKYPNNLSVIESSQNYFRAEGDSFQIIFRVNPETGDIVINNPIIRNVKVGGVAISYQIGNTTSAEDGTISTMKGFLSKGVINHGGNKIYFDFATSDGTDRTKLVEQIISTFKFTDSVGTSSWKTYHEVQHDYFAFKYPSNLVLKESNFQNDYYLPITPNFIRGGQVLAVVEFPKNLYSTNTNYDGAFVSVAVNKDLSQSDCYKKYTESGGVSLTDQVNSNGITFYLGEVSGVGMSHQATDKIYHAFYNKMCFEVDLGIRTQTGTNPSQNIDEGALFKKLEEIFSTLTFKTFNL